MILSDIADLLKTDVSPENAGIDILRITEPQNADNSSIIFVTHPRFEAAATESSAAAVVVKKGKPVHGKPCLEVADPYCAYALLSQAFEDVSYPFDGLQRLNAVIHEKSDIHATVSIGPSSVIAHNVHIEARTTIGAGCIIENDVVIGSDCRIDAGVVIRSKTHIGHRVIIESGTVLGSHGFGNAWDGERFIRIVPFGGVRIEDDVWIGANTTIDRGSFGDTIISRGVRIDNLCHLAHNVEIGQHSAMAAQVGISGSTKIGQHVMIGGQAGFVGHITIGDSSFVGAKAGISKDVEPGAKVTGYPAREFMFMRRIEAAQQRLPDMIKELKQLRRDVEKLVKRHSEGDE